VTKKSARSSGKRKKWGVPGPLGSLVVIGLLIVGSIFLLEYLRERIPASRVPAPAPSSPRQEPSVHPVPPRYGDYTAPVPVHVPKHRRRAVSGSGVVAIIIDDMGSSLQEARSLIDIGVPLTFAIIPGLAKGKAVDALAHDNGYGIMIHMPMEPKGYPQQRLEYNGLLLSQSDDEIVRRLTSYFPLVPHATGANNHMGSRFTEDRQKMTLVMSVLKDHGMFFVDSVTSPSSVGMALAREAGVPAAARSVFLDNVQDVAAITAQLRQLADKARRHGAAVGICHPHRATIQALAQTLPVMREEGIRFVKVATLVR
jgi:polysaccharide deacetylase 2 family uncharacterized protein YibQ